MKCKAMIVISFVIGLIVLVFILGKLNMSIRFSREIKELFRQSEDHSTRRYNKTELEGLPEPIQRYFIHTLKDGQPYIRYARIKHDGQFKADLHKGWMKIVGEQYATTKKPGFIWKGTTQLFVARDMYIADKGRLIVSLLSLINIVDARGKEKYDIGELLRWLGESILYPTNFLPSQRLQWLPIDSNTARMEFEYNGLSLFFIVTVNALGEITEMETKRYMGEGDLETWVIKSSNYQSKNNVLIPTYFDVLWRLKGVDYSYARFHITDIEYNEPVQF